MNGFFTTSEKSDGCERHARVSITEQLIALANEAFASSRGLHHLDRPDDREHRSDTAKAPIGPHGSSAQ
jgi:hypothetical protein